MSTKGKPLKISHLMKMEYIEKVKNRKYWEITLNRINEGMNCPIKLYLFKTKNKKNNKNNYKIIKIYITRVSYKWKTGKLRII
jgi:hypothetical protein